MCPWSVSIKIQNLNQFQLDTQLTVQLQIPLISIFRLCLIPLLVQCENGKPSRLNLQIYHLYQGVRSQTPCIPDKSPFLEGSLPVFRGIFHLLPISLFPPFFQLASPRRLFKLLVARTTMFSYPHSTYTYIYFHINILSLLAWIKCNNIIRKSGKITHFIK